jgi:molybdopterin molybdotransferase
MIPFRDALERMHSSVRQLLVEEVRIEDATGRVLRQVIGADRDFPSFDRVMMDGYALRAADASTHRDFRIVGSAPAGQPQAMLPAGHAVCLEVMTGAPMPVGADAIVPVEHTRHAAEGGMTISLEYRVEPGRYLHPAGSDANAGEVLVEPGVRIDSRVVGVAASCGVTRLQVSRLPRIGIQPTGDELVAVDAMPERHQLRQSNGHAIHAALASAGYAADIHPPLGDDSTAESLRALVETKDWLVFTGAVSRGARDFLPGLLAEIGCVCVFHGVAQRPGKPAGFWLGPQGQAILALPGNPVSALTGLHAFALPALAMASGLPRPKPRLVLPAGPLPALQDMTLHLPVRFDEAGRVHAAPTYNSGDFIGLLHSDGFVTLPPSGVCPAAHPFTPWL